MNRFAALPALALILLALVAPSGPASARDGDGATILPRAHWANGAIERLRDRHVREGRPGFPAARRAPLTRAEAARIVHEIERRGDPADWRDLIRLRHEFAAELAALEARTVRLDDGAAALRRDAADWEARRRRAPRGPAVSVETRLRHESNRYDTVAGPAGNAENTSLRTRVNLRYGGEEDPVSAGGVFDLHAPRRRR